MDVEEFRRLALSLPEATEEPHFEMTSFRVRGRIFATVPPEGRFAHIFVEESEVQACAAERPAVFEELWWGRKLSGVRVRLARAGVRQVRELLEQAWRRRAPKRLAATLEDG